MEIATARAALFACVASLGFGAGSATAQAMELNGFNPNYLLLGADSLESNVGEGNGDCDVKFQLSFSKRISAPPGVRNWRWVRRFGEHASLHFGATQKSWWDVCRHSAPFRESNYEPSLFIKLPLAETEPDRNVFVGYVHESNGRDGEESTGWDRLFARYRTPLSSGASSREPIVDLTLWYPFNVSDNNDRIEDFAGYGELGLQIEVARRVQARLTLQKGGNLTRWRRGHGELDLVIGFARSDVSLLVQFTNGYASSLERVEQHEYALRLGIQFSGFETPLR